MAGKDDISPDEGGPVFLKLREGDAGVYFSAASITADFKAKSPFLGMLEVAFLVGTLVVHGDLGVALEEVGEAMEGVGQRVGLVHGGRGRWLDEVLKVHVLSSAVVHGDSVFFNWVDSGSVEERGSWKRDILDGASSHCAVDIKVDPSAWREWLGDRVGAISVESAREATIIFDGERKVGDWKAAFIKPEGGRAVV